VDARDARPSGGGGSGGSGQGRPTASGCQFTPDAAAHPAAAGLMLMLVIAIGSRVRSRRP
jgi:MYXO-CTERM domain-containing protein